MNSSKCDKITVLRKTLDCNLSDIGQGQGRDEVKWFILPRDADAVTTV